jgi:hypothetical protein
MKDSAYCKKCGKVLRFRSTRGSLPMGYCTDEDCEFYGLLKVVL